MSRRPRGGLDRLDLALIVLGALALGLVLVAALAT